MQIIIKKNIILIVALMCLSLIFCSHSLSDTSPRSTTVEVMGFGRIYKGDESEAKKVAESSSLNIAIQNVLVDILSTSIIISNFKEMNDIIKKYKSDFILNYQVLTQYKENNIYRVFVQANVSIDQILLRLSEEGIILDASKMPSIVILVSEKNVGDNAYKFWWQRNSHHKKTIAESELEKVIKKRGYYIIDYNQFEHSAEMSKNHDLSDEEAASIGLNLGAEVVITGEAVVVSSGGTVGDSKSFKSLVKLRALRTDDHNVLAKTENTSSALNSDRELGGQAAIEKAIKFAGDDLASAIMKAWQVEKSKPTIIRANIFGKNYLPYLVKLRKMLREMDGINNVQTEKVRTKRAILVIDYKGNVKKLAEIMVSKTFQKFIINISEITDDSMNIELLSK